MPRLVSVSLLLLSAALIAAPLADVSRAADGKKVVFVAGNRSHGYGSHEHYAGCVLLAKSLEQAAPGIKTVVYRNGWPKEANAFDGADTVVMYADGGGRHPVIPHLARLDKLARSGVGVVTIHYAVEAPKGPAGDKLRDWTGGYFETHWSVNPHWTASFQKLPEHPITRGVKPFAINDEWYYHMRFRDNMKGVTPILSAVPPASTLSRPDGAHSGNPHVRREAGKPQHVAWASENEGGGRGFGFTGGHYHWNWGDPNFRKVVLNAIVWTAKGEVPAGGIEVKKVTVKQLQENQDYDPPKNFDPRRVLAHLSGSTTPKPQKPRGSKVNTSKVKPIHTSALVTKKTPGHAVEIDVDITGADQLHLVADDGGNGYSCDWVDWAEPRLVGPNGEVKLTSLKWTSASSGFGSVRVNRNCQGQPMKLAGKSVAYGIGAHANSIISYKLPAGYTRFKARGGLDNGGVSQGACGESASVRVLVFTKKPPLTIARKNRGGGGGSRETEDAVSGLDIADGLEATLFASEPELQSLTNLDIDHRGRIWVCEVVNYRRHNGKRPAGDRILILEDTSGDGKADSQKVFYQGRDIDSAMGICVLGNKVIVSSSPRVLVLTDTNGDDKADKKEVLFDKTGQPQHDHSAHSFLFGPDGKLYWNFGNTGKAVHDKDGKPVVDKNGNRVVDNGKPYYGGMPFRCNLDGSGFEVLGHNFRNNYEVSVDSFGTLWQSDNDDDGNRGVRINYVMEYGNYGYRDEMTGAGWKSNRENKEKEIPLQHWHLNDPGVVPNLLQTGAGSPTGITVYEGRLLPKVFWDEVIHCDAGPNVVRAYPARKDGAGYSAEMVNVMHGARDKWFRPADVCVAPDGSLFVTDWYDPGVGGHAQGDLDRGRLYRIAPPGSKYKTPKLDFDTVAGAIEALQNPALSVRYLAWTALHKMGAKAEPALLKLYGSENPRFRARALWLLGKIPGRGQHYVELAAGDRNSDIRIVAIRLARQLDGEILPLLTKLASDKSAQVRREVAVALHDIQSPAAAKVWADLALQHDGKDRWYLEALGIGANGKWDECLAAYLKKAGDQWKTAAGRDIVWRSRAKETPAYLARMIKEKIAPEAEHPRIMRAFDFNKGPEADKALQSLLGL